MTTRRKFIQQASLTATGTFIINPLVQQLMAKEMNSRFDFPESDMTSLRFRQVHLDFHTNGTIPDIAKNFDPERFVHTLKKAAVNSVTVFAKCCHGYFYYDTKAFPELIHPHLTNKNLLKQQIEACHKAGIRTPIYTVIQWDVMASRYHNDWLMMDEKGYPIGATLNEPGFTRFLCVNTPYTDFTKKYIAEVHEMLPVDGWFIDIVMEKPCNCAHCIRGIESERMNPYNQQDVILYSHKMFRRWKTDITSHIRSMSKDCSIFYNTGHVAPYIRRTIDNYTHLELESLPSGSEWGYMHFPLTVRYARNLGKDFMGMTGKFHTFWGDFNSLKNKAALELEIFTMLANNAKCSIGDQLHPSGVLDEATYDLIGSVYKQVEQKEPWCQGALSATDIAVFNIEEFVDTKGERVPAQSVGAVRILQESKHQFDVIDSQMDFTKYKLLILPDNIPVDAAFKTKLDEYVAGGGKLIVSYKSGLSIDGKSFALDMGIDYVSDAPYNPDFLSLKEDFAVGLPEEDFVMYMRGVEIKNNSATILAFANAPYFNRTAEHFNSHLHAPSTGKPVYPAIVNSKNSIIYFSHPVFTQYAKNAPSWCKGVMAAAIELLLPQPLVKTSNAPSSLTVTLNVQQKENRLVLHALHYIPERRGFDFDTVEDVIPLSNIQFSVQVGNKKISKVKAVPQGTAIAHKVKNGRVAFVLPKINGHQMVEIS